MKIVTDVLLKSFTKQIVMYILRLLALHLGIGFLLGLWAGLLTRNRWLRPVIVLGLHSLFYLRQMILTPQLFAEYWLAHGGILAAVQAAITDHVSPVIPEAMLAALMMAALVSTVFRLRGSKGILAGSATVFATSLLIAGFVIFAAGSYSLTSRESAMVTKAGVKGAATAASTKPNILLIGIDSLRPDKLSGNGYRRNTSPHIDAVMAGGSFFPRCYTPLPRTFPALVSLFTGTTPPRHGVRNMFPTLENRAFLPTPFPESLRKAGWKTAVVSDFAGDIFPRVELGFEQVLAPTFTILTLGQIRLMELMTHLLPYVNNGAGRRILPVIWELVQNADPKVLTDEALGELDHLAGKPPFFMMIFYSTTHFPFAPPYPYYKTYTDPAYNGSYRYHKYTILGRPDVVTDADKVQVNALYDGALASVDEQVGRLIERLKWLGISDNTIVVIMGDHGEDLYETPDTPVAHGEQIRTEYPLKTPLILSGPGVPKGQRFENRIRVIDVAPTLSDLVGVDASGYEGKSATPIMAGGNEKDRTVYAETGLWFDYKTGGFVQKQRILYPDVTRILEEDPVVNHEMVIQPQWEKLTDWAKHRAWIEGDWKLIRIPLITGVIYELYDLASDPGCFHDLSAEKPDVVSDLSRHLEDYMKGMWP